MIESGPNINRVLGAAVQYAERYWVAVRNGKLELIDRPGFLRRFFSCLRPAGSSFREINDHIVSHLNQSQWKSAETARRLKALSDKSQGQREAFAAAIEALRPVEEVTVTAAVADAAGGAWTWLTTTFWGASETVVDTGAVVAEIAQEFDPAEAGRVVVGAVTAGFGIFAIGALFRNGIGLAARVFTGGLLS